MPKGLILIAVIFAISVLFSVYMSVVVSGEEKIIWYISAILNGLLFYGLIRKNNLARLAIILFSWLAIILSVISVGIFIWVVMNTKNTADLSSAIGMLVLSNAISILISSLVLWYLKKPRVIRLFK